MPNTGIIDENSLLGLTKKNSESKIYTTFIGIGIDFNTNLIESITKIRGCNYYSVHSYKEFMTRMDTQFEFMVTPLVFNLNLRLKSDNNKYIIDKIYGSPEADQSTGEIMKINTLFPSSSNDDGEIKGGITLIKLKKITNDTDDPSKSKSNLKLHVKYEDRKGVLADNHLSVIFDGTQKERKNKFENNGIRKAILLSQYVELMKEWIDDENGYNEENKENNNNTSKWEQQSKQLNVNDKYKEKFLLFYQYFVNEMKELNDETLQKEADILQKLAQYDRSES